MVTKRKKAWLDVIKALTVKMKHIDHLSWEEELQDPIGRRGQWGGYLPTPDDTLAPSALRTNTLHVVFGFAEPMAPSHRMTCAAVAEKK